MAGAYPGQGGFSLIPLRQDQGSVLPTSGESAEKIVDARHDLGQRGGILAAGPQAGLDVGGHQPRGNTLAGDVGDHDPPSAAASRDHVPVVAPHLQTRPHLGLQLESGNQGAVLRLQRALDLRRQPDLLPETFTGDGLGVKTRGGESDREGDPELGEELHVLLGEPPAAVVEKLEHGRQAVLAIANRDRQERARAKTRGPIDTRIEARILVRILENLGFSARRHRSDDSLSEIEIQRP